MVAEAPVANPLPRWVAAVAAWAAWAAWTSKSNVTNYELGPGAIRGLFCRFRFALELTKKERRFRSKNVADARIIDNAKTGALFYDTDGSGTDHAAIKFAQVKAGTLLKAADFFIV